MFYFHSLDSSTVGTRKRLCVFGRRTRTRTLCIWRCCVDIWWLVHQWFWVFWVFLTIGTVYHSSKTVKNSQKTVKQQKMIIGVPIVTCLYRVRRIYKAAQTPLPCETSITRAWEVATARRPWAGLTVWTVWTYQLPNHGRLCVWLPFAAACCYTLFYLLMMPAARLVCQRPSSNFCIFLDPTRKLSALPPELRRIR